MPAGRPTLYQDTFPQIVLDYLETCGREQTKLPKRGDVAMILGVDQHAIQDWEEAVFPDGSLKYPEFSTAIKRVDEAQQNQLMDDGMYGGKEVNSSMAIFLLKANHNMIETERKMLVGKEGNDLKINLVTYGNHDPLSVYANSPDARGVGGSPSIPSPQLASQSTQDNISSQSINQMGELG